MDKKAYFDKYCWKKLVDRLSKQTFCLHLLIEVTSRLNPLEIAEEDLQDIELDLMDFCEIVQLTGANRYQIVKRAIKKILETAIDFETNSKWQAIPFFNAKRTCILNKSKMSISVNSEFIPYLADLKKFLVIKRDDICLSNRCLIFLTYLKAECFKPTIKKPWQDVQSACGVAYESYYDFKRYFLNPVIKEMLTKKIKVTYEVYKKSSKVDLLSFTLEDLREAEDLEIESITCATKVAEINDKVQEVFDIFNEELVKVFGAKRKLRSLDPSAKDGKRRIKDIKELLKLDVDLRQLFRNFFLVRKEQNNYHFDFDYVLRRLDTYLNYKPKPANGHVTPIFRNDPRMEAKLRLERQEREHEKLKEPSEFNVLEELGGF